MISTSPLGRLALGRLALGAFPLLWLLGCSEAPIDAWRPPPAPDGGPAVVISDLPCDVAQLLSSRCVPCHADPPVGASEAFTSYEALTAPSLSDPSKRIVDVAIELMGSDTDPMPPEPAVRGTDAEIAVLQGWIDAGLPTGTCAVENPYDTPLGLCTTDTRWTGGNRESARMRPGGACIACHADMREGPWFSVAGTVYASAHEPDDCNGTPPGTDVPVVEITDAVGRVVQLEPNGAGNFYSRSLLMLPYTARVLYQGRERVMVTPQDSGDCNACHTETGTDGAHGRVMLP